MGYLYTDADKVYTNSSMLDELIHNIKLILQGIILKDQNEAELNETQESIEQSDTFLAITDGTVRFSEFHYNEHLLRELNQYIIDNELELDLLTEEQIYDYIIDNDEIPKAYRSILLQIASDEFMASYVELNNYYRRLNGQKDIGDADFYVDISYIPSNYYQQFIPEEVLAAYDPGDKSTFEIRADMKEMCKEYLLSTPITSFTSYQISLMDSSGIMEHILNDNTGCPYLRHLGAKKIDIYKARKAQRFEILYMPDCEGQIRKRFQDIFDTTRVMYLKRFYSTAYKFENEYYDKFFMILLLCQVANDIIVEMPEYFISRTVFDSRTVQTILEANGVKYFPEIPLKYQVAMVRALNTLIKYKSTTKNIFDIANLFSLKNVEISKYYILKRRNISSDEVDPFDLNGGYAQDATVYDKKHEADAGFPGTGEDGEALTMYDGGYPHKSTNFLSAADLNKMYTLEFIRVPIGDTLDNYIRNALYHTPYDTITNNDPYWDGPYTHEYVKYKILQKDFTVQSTKYLSLTSGYSSKDFLFQTVYFLNMIMNTSADSVWLNLSVPVISQSATFNIHDLIIMLFCLSCRYFDPATDDIINIKNRDPRPATYVDPAVMIGDYDPAVINDYDCNGSMPASHPEYYNADGGPALTSRFKYININAGHVINPTVAIDFPETMEIDFDRATTDTDFDALGAFEYLEVEQLDAGDAFSAVFDRYNDVYDGGYVVNSYLYDGEDTGLKDDPCQKYRETFDRFRFPTIDLSNRLLGFNSTANFAELQSNIGKVYLARFQYLRGFHINELIPARTQKINMYNGRSLFPDQGVIGQLYEDMTTGKYYYWNYDGYSPIRTLYSKGIQDFMTPTDNRYYSIDEVVEMYKNNKEIYDNLTEVIKDCDNQEEFWVLQYVYEYLFTMELDWSYLTLPSTGKMATRYSEFLKEKDGILYAFYEKLVSETNTETRQYNMSSMLDQVIESIQQYLATDVLEYIFYFVPTVSLGTTLKYVGMLLNFFKSYKTYILDVGSSMQLESYIDNMALEKDNIDFKGFSYTKGDPASLYDRYAFNLTLEKDEPNERFEDRMYVREKFLQRWVDINGGRVEQNYWFDIDADDNTLNPGYNWPYTQYYVLDGGPPEDAVVVVPEYAPLYSPHLRGIPTVPTPPLDDESDRIANTEWFWLQFNWRLIPTADPYAKLDSPHFRGIPTVPTPSDDDNSDRIANTEFFWNQYRWRPVPPDET